MTVYRLPRENVFPPPEQADEDGLLAVGGDLSPERLLLAYASGVFPWPHRGLPMLWFSPDPRMVLFPQELKLSRSLRQSLRRGRYVIRLDTEFDAVVRGCRDAPRPGQQDTWITHPMRVAYGRLHELGFAHSVESWHGNELVGGLYGVSLGAAFFGESMFARETDASKLAFAVLVMQLESWGFHFVDAQVHTAHLQRFGARLIPRAEYLQRLQEALKAPTRKGPWRLDADAAPKPVAPAP
jgi:leucyl/phenylalanyl-tRNA---protein transferase